MPLAQGASILGPNVAAFRYGTEMRPYTFLDPALGPGVPEELIALQSVGRDLHTGAAYEGNGLLVVLSDWAQTPNAAVNLLVDFGGRATVAAGAAQQDWNVAPQRQIPTSLFPSGLQPILPGPAAGWTTPERCLVSWQNTSAAALTTPTQLTVSAWVWPMPAWQAMRLGLPVSDRVQALWAQYGEYLIPWDFDTALAHIWGHAWLGDEELGAVVTAGANPLPVVPTLTVRSNEVVVLRAVAVSLPANSVGNQILLTVARDGSQPTHSLWLDNAAGLTTPFRWWLAATNQLNFAVAAQTVTAGVVVRIRVSHYLRTPLLAAWMGLQEPPTQGAAALAYAEAVLGGWIR
jgi:hypothetical protein